MTVVGKIDPQQRPASSQDNAPVPDSGLRALTAVARHFQLDWSLTRLSHVYGKEHEPDAREIVRIARAEGLKAEAHRANWKSLAKLQKQTPFLVRLKTGGWFVVLKVGQEATKHAAGENGAAEHLSPLAVPAVGPGYSGRTLMFSPSWTHQHRPMRRASQSLRLALAHRQAGHRREAQNGQRLEQRYLASACQHRYC